MNIENQTTEKTKNFVEICFSKKSKLTWEKIYSKISKKRWEKWKYYSLTNWLHEIKRKSYKREDLEAFAKVLSKTNYW